MMKKIEHVFPFLWLKGEDENLIRQEIAAIYNSGLRAFCVESRIHPNFCEERWFADMEIVLKEAKRREMQVWLLDDKSYPTGMANGIIAKQYPHLKGWQIVLEFVDIAGKVLNAKIPLPLKENEELLGAFLCRRTYDGIVYSSLKEVTQNIKQGKLSIDIPCGSHRVFFLYKSQNYAERNNYIDMLNPVSASKIIEAVYQPHYERFKEYFGTTFVGFFSDEPRLCNGKSDKLIFHQPATYCGLGIKGLSYPYADGLEKEIGLREKKEWLQLWFDADESADFRCRYMNAITKRYSKNFNQALSSWCHERGVLYSGHIIEDSGAHLRTVCSSGHYFRSMEGADMAGVDVVLHQIKPFETDNKHYAHIAGGYADPKFFNYTLAKLASSSANLDPIKGGKALCEAFGAYGWTESTQEMLYTANHLLTRGINYFIPHAFSMENDDQDCPPHFYAGGNNPAYKGYGVLFSYLQDMGELFSGGTSFSDVAVLYHDEGEWSGKTHTPCDEVNKLLTENQIDFDIVWTDILKEFVMRENGLQYNGRTYQYVVVPPTSFLTETTIEILKNFGDRVVFTGKALAPFGHKVELKFLSKFLCQNGVKVKTQNHCKGLRIYDYEKNGKLYSLLFNESGQRISFGFADEKERYGYDVMQRRAYCFKAQDKICLDPAQAILVGDFAKELHRDEPACQKSVRYADIYLRSYQEKEFTFYKKAPLPFCVNDVEELRDFCGDIRYEFTVDFSNSNDLFIDYTGEFCQVEIEGKRELSIGGKLLRDVRESSGKKVVRLTIANTLTYAWQDELRKYSYQPSACIYKIKY